MRKIAIVGGGITGLGTAYALRDVADITLFEARDRLGGHACTVDISIEGRLVPVDVGFIVCNPLNYPNLMGLFKDLNVETVDSDMSFALSDPDGFEWSSNRSGLFAKKRNLFSVRYIRFLLTILKFNRQARADLENRSVPDVTMSEYLEYHGYSSTFRSNYILPMGAAIWSTPERDMLDYPAETFLRFFDNHRLLQSERPTWRTVKDGSRTYVEKIAAVLGQRVQTNAKVTSIQKHSDGIGLSLQDGTVHEFDDVILCCHSDQSKDLLSHEFSDVSDLLENVRYRPNQAYLHTDTTLMPKRRTAWGSWNVLKVDQDDVCLSYWMNLLQRLPIKTPVLVTLNPPKPPKEELTHLSFTFDHPQFDQACERAVAQLKDLNGRNGLWLAGAWMGQGFHEDGLRSGLAVALSLGGKVPWDSSTVPAYTASSTSDPHVTELSKHETTL